VFAVSLFQVCFDREDPEEQQTSIVQRKDVECIQKVENKD
jgi:hypothetical protein